MVRNILLLQGQKGQDESVALCYRKLLASISLVARILDMVYFIWWSPIPWIRDRNVLSRPTPWHRLCYVLVAHLLAIAYRVHGGCHILKTNKVYVGRPAFRHCLSRHVLAIHTYLDIAYRMYGRNSKSRDKVPRRRE